MCKNAYEQISNNTMKTIIFCKLMGDDGQLDQICISQKFCREKDRYVELNQKRDCKYFKD